MLSSILAKSSCAACKFCCSFRRTSLWETPVFPAADLPKLQALNPDAKFRPAGPGAENAGNPTITNNPPAGPDATSYTFDLRSSYRTDDPAEEAPCPFLDPARGCTLPQDLKPFECKIWPLRAVRTPQSVSSAAIPEPPESSASPNTSTSSPVSVSVSVALTPTCPAINKVPLDRVRDLAASGLGQQILDYANEHPDIIKEASEFLSNIIYPL